MALILPVNPAAVGGHSRAEARPWSVYVVHHPPPQPGLTSGEPQVAKSQQAWLPGGSAMLTYAHLGSAWHAAWHAASVVSPASERITALLG